MSNSSKYLVTPSIGLPVANTTVTPFFLASSIAFLVLSDTVLSFLNKVPSISNAINL